MYLESPEARLELDEVQSLVVTDVMFSVRAVVMNLKSFIPRLRNIITVLMLMGSLSPCKIIDRSLLE